VFYERKKKKNEINFSLTENCLKHIDNEENLAKHLKEKHENEIQSLIDLNTIKTLKPNHQNNCNHKNYVNQQNSGNQQNYVNQQNNINQQNNGNQQTSTTIDLNDDDSDNVSTARNETEF
jgi:hypothetical protein